MRNLYLYLFRFIWIARREQSLVMRITLFYNKMNFAKVTISDSKIVENRVDLSTRIKHLFISSIPRNRLKRLETRSSRVTLNRITRLTGTYSPFRSVTTPKRWNLSRIHTPGSVPMQTSVPRWIPVGLRGQDVTGRKLSLYIREIARSGFLSRQRCPCYNRL